MNCLSDFMHLYMTYLLWSRISSYTASSLFNIPTQLECLLQRAHQMVIVAGGDNNSLQRRFIFYIETRREMEKLRGILQNAVP